MDDDVLFRKAETLLRTLDNSDPPYRDERLLVSLVLLTRIQDNTRLCRFCETYPLLQTFMIRILVKRHHETIFVRLALFLLSKCSNVWGKEELVVLLQSLFQALEHRLVYTRLEQVDVDLVIAVHACLDAQPENNTSKATINDVISTIWQHFLKTRKAASPNHSTAKNLQESNDWKLMSQTLEALLAQNDSTTVEERWENAVFSAMQRHAPVACLDANDIPLFYESLLTHCASSTGAARVEWNGVLLACTRALSSSTDLNSLSKWLVQHQNNVTSSIIKLLFTHVTVQQQRSASNDMNDNLRSLAWDTLGALVYGCGWDWMLIERSSSSSQTLGRASNLCAVLRVASGEWRIQLGMVLEEDQTKIAEVEEEDSSSVVIVDSCGRVLVAATAYMVELAQSQQDDEQALSLEADALLHARHSLRDALHATLEYWLLYEDKTAVSNINSDEIRVCVCRVLGSLLPDMMGDLPYEEDSTLTALRSALLYVHGKEDIETSTMTCLLPALVTVLSSIDEGSLRQHDLLKSDVVMDSVIAHLNRLLGESDWTETASSVTWSCHVLEMWCDMAKPNRRKKRECSKALLPWIQKYLDEQQGTRDKQQSVLSATVGCYMTLMEDSIPSSDLEKLLIEQALRQC